MLFPNLPIEKRVTISVPYTEYKSFCARDPLSFRNLKNVKKEIWEFETLQIKILQSK